MAKDNFVEQQRRVIYIGLILAVFIGIIGIFAVNLFFGLPHLLNFPRSSLMGPVINYPLLIELLFVSCICLLFLLGWRIYLALKKLQTEY